jgi:hypothetical protein
MLTRVDSEKREYGLLSKFAAKAAGTEQSILFRVNYNARLKAGLYLEFRGDTFFIQSVDGYEWYERDLTLRAARCKAEVCDHETYYE